MRGDLPNPPAAATANPNGTATEETRWPQAPGYYRFRLGSFRVTVLSDGSVERDLPSLMSDPELVRACFHAGHQRLPVQLSVNCFLIETGSHRMLVDTGAGELFGPGVAGQLLTNLHAAGHAPDDIDTVLLTHIHGDHSGGLSIGGQPAFRNAEVYVDAADPAFWLNGVAEASAPKSRRTSFEQSRRTVGPYEAAGRLRTFHAPADLFPGVRAISLRGHTPGQSGFLIESQDQRLLLWGDVVHAAEVQFQHPKVTIQYDVDENAAAITRERLLAEVADSGVLIGGAHLSFPGLGYVSRSASGYAWTPRPWSAQP